jgi:hypothetical protein
MSRKRLLLEQGLPHPAYSLTIPDEGTDASYLGILSRKQPTDQAAGATSGRWFCHNAEDADGDAW